MTNTRREDWWHHLQETVRTWEALPFKFGETDCAMFAAACIYAVRGVDPAATWRGIYETRLGSVARLRYRGFRLLEQAAESELLKIGAFEIDPRAAQCGDIGVCGGDMLAVRMPIGFIARRAEGGFGVAKVHRAWAI